MSSKISLFLTNDDEHWYLDVNDNSITLEFDKKNIEILSNDKYELVIEVKKGSELWNNIIKTRE